MFSKTVEYALRAMVHLQECEQSEQRGQPVEQVAARTQVPLSYLSKVLQSLARAGLITSQRGIGGGFRLAESAREITIYDVVQAVDPIRRIDFCPLGLAAHGDKLCPLHKKMDDALALVETQFRTTTLAEVIGNSSPQKPLGALCAAAEKAQTSTV
jgi:Rrf2 family protein